MSRRVDSHRPHHAPKPSNASAPKEAPRAQAAAAKPSPAERQKRDALVRDLRRDPDFQKLPRGTQARLLATAKKYGTSDNARRNIRNAALDPDLRKLKPSQQREAVKTLRAAAKERGVGKNISRLASDKDFRKLSAAEQKNVLQGLRENRHDAAARGSLVGLANSSGFGKVNRAVQHQLVDTISKPRAGSAEAQFGNSARSLVGDGDFRRLGPQLQSQIANRLSPEGGLTHNTRDQLINLATEPGLEKLAPELQSKVVNGLRSTKFGEPEDFRNDAIVGLVQKPNFGFLPGDLQNRAIDSVLDARVTPDRASNLAAAIGSPGFRRLDRATQDNLFRFANGADKFTASINDRLGGLVNGDAYVKASPDSQAAQLKALLTRPFGSVPGIPDRPRPYSIAGPVEAPGSTFPSGTQDALRYDVTIDGRTVPVFISKAQDPARGSYHNIDEVAHALANLPPANLALVTEVRVDGGRNPSDAHFAEIYGRPDFRSYMTAGAQGSITIYPTEGHVDQAEMNAAITHETGHTLSFRHWGSSYDDTRWSGWKNAIATDAASPSDYGNETPGEDFAEALALYTAVRGTPDEASARSLMPERFRIIDELLSQQPPPYPGVA